MPSVAVFKKCIRAVTSPFFRLRRKMPMEIEKISVKAKDLPQKLNGCRLAVIADLHLPDSAVDISALLEAVQAQQPHAILLAGDLINRYNTRPTDAIAALASKIIDIAPTFAVAGNHELLSGRLAEYRQVLEEAGVTFLCDEQTAFLCNGENLYIYGVCDRHAPLPQKLPHPSILLIHYPEFAMRAHIEGCICAVSGHAHGGQVRFGKRGLFAPGQGFFPRYISGHYNNGQFPVIITRGLGDSSLPIRINNRPHLPIITFIQG